MSGLCFLTRLRFVEDNFTKNRFNIHPNCLFLFAEQGGVSKSPLKPFDTPLFNT